MHDLFEEQTSLEKVILKIMQRAQRLLKCEKAAVLLVDENSDVSSNHAPHSTHQTILIRVHLQVMKFSKLFELDSQISGKKK